MSRGVPKALMRRGRKKLPPPVDRNAHVYRDMSEPEKKAEAKAEAPPPLKPKPAPAKPKPVKAEAKKPEPDPKKAEAKAEPEPKKAEAKKPEPKEAKKAEAAPPAEKKAVKQVTGGLNRRRKKAEASMDLKRDQLDEIAASLGVEDPEKLPNKQAVLDSIESA